LVQIFPVYACNFKCNYCALSLPHAERGYVSNAKFLDFDLYCKAIDELRGFPKKLRLLRFAGTGEPLLHPKIAEMVAYAAQADIADSIDIVTNGSLLSEEMSRALVAAGVSRVRISVQGVSREKYLETTATYADLEKIVANAAGFYARRGQAELYIKIIDSALESKKDEERFFQLFGDICDALSIEHLVPATWRINYSRLAHKSKLDKTQNGFPVNLAKICPQPFYMLQVNPDANLVPCCAMESPLALGSLKNESMRDIWLGKTLNRFRRMLLDGRRGENPVCRDCQLFRYGMYPEDVLDGHVEHLMDVYPDGETTSPNEGDAA
jgi:radical SAM protein with 4Fe4S-binding SPASM domain